MRVERSVSGKIATQHSYLGYFCDLCSPNLEYCVAAWSPHYIKDKDLIERIQRRFTKMIPDLRSSSYEERLRKTRLWTLEDRRVRADLL